MIPVLSPPIRGAVLCGAAALLGLALLAGAVTAQTTGDPSRGEARAASCASCHGSGGGVPLAGMPSLAGQQREFLALQMILMRDGHRDVPQMNGLFRAMSDGDIRDIAAYFSAEAPADGGGRRDAKRHARGAALSQDMGCNSCHMTGYAGQGQVPLLANQREDYLSMTLKAYRDNRRTGADTSMNSVMYQVSDADIDALAHYFAHQ